MFLAWFLHSNCTALVDWGTYIDTATEVEEVEEEAVGEIIRFFVSLLFSASERLGIHHCAKREFGSGPHSTRDPPRVPLCAVRYSK